jgi:hypothetical protein
MPATAAPAGPQSESPVPLPQAPFLATFSVLAFGVQVPGRVLFPGRDRWPIATAGYVRSVARAQLIGQNGPVESESDRTLPWRDYPSALLAAPESLITAPYEHHSVVISARNTLNEWGYQLRLGGEWVRRGYQKQYEDKPISPDWPVITFGVEGASIMRLADTKDAMDLVTGVPLVIAGRPSSRPFLVACCSDVAHVFDVNPKGQGGRSPDAWLRLSNHWQELKDRGQSDADLAKQMEDEAKRLGVGPSRDLLHSAVVQRYDGTLVAFAVTGALTDIASELAQRWDVEHAILLDNGGSVGWQALVTGDEAPKLLLSGPNYRPRGTAFMQFDIGDFLQPKSHPLLAR